MEAIIGFEHHVALFVDSNVSEETSASIVRIDSYPEDGGNILLRNVDINLPVYTVSTYMTTI
jgi:hypothetical protein